MNLVVTVDGFSTIWTGFIVYIIDNALPLPQRPWEKFRYFFNKEKIIYFQGVYIELRSLGIPVPQPLVRRSHDP